LKIDIVVESLPKSKPSPTFGKLNDHAAVTTWPLLVSGESSWIMDMFIEAPDDEIKAVKVLLDLTGNLTVLFETQGHRKECH
jgi:hypothetical protein